MRRRTVAAPGVPPVPPIPEFTEALLVNGAKAPRSSGRLVAARIMLTTSIVILLAAAGIATARIFYTSIGPTGFWAGLLLALAPVPVVVSAFLWLDRVEPEPTRELLLSFFWGACAATLFAVIVNTSIIDALAASGNTDRARFLGIVVAAPLVEELGKGLIIGILALRRSEFDGTTDGIVTAGITAAGFAFAENIFYFGDAWTQGAGYTDNLTSIFVLRAVLAPFSHPLFTIVLGIGIAAATRTTNRTRRLLYPAAGYAGAVTLHAAWNASTTLGGTFFISYLLVMAPAFLMGIWLAVRSQRRETSVLAKWVQAYADKGWLIHADIPMLSSPQDRRHTWHAAKHTLGKPGAKAIRRYQINATELAFLRERASVGNLPHDFTTRETTLLNSLYHDHLLLTDNPNSLQGLGKVSRLGV